MTIEEVRSEFQVMKSHFKGGFSYKEQQYIESIYISLFNKPMQKRSGCQDCYRDAFILISNKLKTMTEMPKESPYKLKAGVVASSFGSSDFYVLDMPEEAAEKWLHEFPERINQFQKFPDDWQDRVNARFASNDPVQEDEINNQEPVEGIEPETEHDPEPEAEQTETEQTQENAPESTIEESNDEDTTGQSVRSRRGKKTANNVN